MTPLPNEWNGKGDQYGWRFKLLYREGNWALVEKAHNSCKRKFWEVFQIQQHEQWEAWGKIYPAQELPPHSNQWGYAGWSYCTVGDATERFLRMAKS